jgi:hypothetical protein
MRHLPLLACLAPLAVATPAAAQLATRSISLESGISAPLARGAAPSVPVALAAAAWLDFDVEVLARVAYASVSQPLVRGADAKAVDVAGGTVGLRWSPGADALRPELLVEAGWETARGAAEPRGGFAIGAGAGLEWFFARDLSLRGRAAARRGVLPGWRLELCLGVAAYF